MIALSWYLLKVIICSGILCGYYFLALRNKAFHRWNRFYILAAIVISLLAPIIKINIFQNDADKGTVVQMLQTISYGDEAVIEYSRDNGFQLTTQNVVEVSYLLISTVFLFIFFISLYKIVILKKKYPETKIEDISFINTNAKGTPFSFFKSVFWNNAIDLHSKSGQQIFNHEIAHIKENHSYDKIFMNIVLIFFWINPFFWLMRKEMYMIHEFIADKEALEDSDISAFAEMILQTVYPGQKFSFTNNFFYSPIKRRIMMLAKNKSPKVSYISRLLVLPIAAIVFFAFTLKVKNNNANLYDGKTITVVIDPGHGGKDNGAVSADGIKEKNITLSIAKKIASLNSNDHIKILLSRDDDKFLSVKDQVVFAENNNADLFISIHVNSSTNKQLNGFSVLIGNDCTAQDQLLGSTLINELKKSYKTDDNIEIRKRGLWILNHNVCPAAIVECGFLSNPGDVAFISNSADQKKIAENILDAIYSFASSKESSDNTSAALIKKTPISTVKLLDTIPSGALIFVNGKEISKDEMNKIPQSNIQSVNILKGETAINKYGEKGKNGVIEINTKNKDDIIINLNEKNDLDIPANSLIIANGKEISKDESKNIDGKNIQSINVLKGENAIKKYGEKGKNGVIEITTKSGNIFAAKKDGSNFTEIPDSTLIFVDGKEIARDEMKDINPANIQSISVLKGESAIKKYGNKAKEGVIEIITKSGNIFAAKKDGSNFQGIPKGTLLFVDGKEISIDELKNDRTKPNNIQSISILKGEEAIKKYGKKGKVEVIEITTKDKSGNLTSASADAKTINGNTSFEQNDSIPDKVFTKVENEASFPGGPSAWQRYILRKIQASLDSFTEADYGTCLLKFIVNTDGSISNVEATTMKGTHLAIISMEAIKDGPKWIPASQNGHVVAAYRLQPVTLMNPDDLQKIKVFPQKVKVFPQRVKFTPDSLNENASTKIQDHPSFPGGQSAWLKYISRIIQKNGNELIANENNQGICKVRFLVNKDGRVSDVQALSKQGTQLAEVAVNAIKQGPRWNPETHDGNAINSYVIQPVGFSLSDKLQVKEPE